MSKNISPKDEEHFIICVNCGCPIDCRDLSQVFYHEGDCLVADKMRIHIPFSSSRKVGDPTEYLKGKTKVDLN